MTVRTPRRLAAALLLPIVAALAASAHPAAAAKKPSCLRGGATLEASSGAVRIVRVTA